MLSEILENCPEAMPAFQAIGMHCMGCALASGENNQLHSFLDKILLKLTYDKWFFGCYHKDTQLSTKSRCVFCDVISMGERHAKRSIR